MQLSVKEKSRLKKNYGEWAVVTGSSSGIGLELTHCLAAAGFNIVICGRDLQKLKKIEQGLVSTFNNKILSVEADFSTQDGIDTLIDKTKGLSVGLFVASAGFGTSGYFVNSSIHTEVNMLRVNCEALLQLTHYFAQQFVHQKKGGIILLSSMVAFQGVPFAANYAATKAYVQTFAEALAVELKPLGVSVLAAAPGPVDSGFGQRADMKMNMSLKPTEVGVPILKALGKKTTVLPGLLTKILVYALRTVPRWGKIKIMSQVMGGMTAHQRN